MNQRLQLNGSPHKRSCYASKKYPPVITQYKQSNKADLLKVQWLKLWIFHLIPTKFVRDLKKYKLLNDSFLCGVHKIQYNSI